MHRTVAFLADNDSRTLHRTARKAREAEFDALVNKIRLGLPDRFEGWSKLASDLRCNIYPAAAAAFIEAADYLRVHRDILTGAMLDPLEKLESNS